MLPQSADSDEIPAFAKHAVQHDGVAVGDGAELQLPAGTEELLDGYGMGLEETGATGTLEVVMQRGEQLLVVVVLTVQELVVTVFVAQVLLVHGTLVHELDVHGTEEHAELVQGRVAQELVVIGIVAQDVVGVDVGVGVLQVPQF